MILKKLFTETFFRDQMTVYLSCIDTTKMSDHFYRALHLTAKL